jgi:hypothetical protein
MTDTGIETPPFLRERARIDPLGVEPAWSAADLRPALLAACLAWRIETEGQRTEQEERRPTGYWLE